MLFAKVASETAKTLQGPWIAVSKIAVLGIQNVQESIKSTNQSEHVKRCAKSQWG